MKPIFLSEKDINEMKEEFNRQVKEGMYDGGFSISRKFEYKNEEKMKAYIYYTPEAFAKMFSLITYYGSEVAWHCLVDRLEEPNEFKIYDIIIYKQTVTGATVNTDQEEYRKFMCDLTEEQANHMYVQCHSHVNMSTNPSSTDTEHQRKILKMMGNHGFYIFQIWNKKFEHTSFIYDLDNNIYYEDKDIECMIEDPDYGTTDTFVESTRNLIVNKSNFTTYPNSYTGNTYKTDKKTKNSDIQITTTDGFKKKLQSWYMTKDPKPEGEEDYDEEIFGSHDYYGRTWDSGYFDS